jgi:orotate phosphoribosyltransferase
MTQDQKYALTLELFEIGAIKFGEFKLKLHEREPNAPLSPIYLTLRPKRSKNPGPIGEDLLERICRFMKDMLEERNISYTHVCGVPHTGDPYADWLAIPNRSSDRKKTIIRLEKRTEEDGTRKVVGIEPGEYSKGDRVLLADDLIVEADSKREAILTLEEGGLIVKDLAVVIDRCQGGISKLNALGYTTHALLTLPEMLIYLENAKCIDEATERRVLQYLKIPV